MMTPTTSRWFRPYDPHGVIDLVALGEAIRGHVDRLWPGETIEQRGNCLAEEAGEVCRAITKRRHAEDRGVFKGMTAGEWSDALRVEAAQTIGVALSILAAEGHDPVMALLDVERALAGRTD